MSERHRWNTLDEAESAQALRILQGIINEITDQSVPITRDTRIDRYILDVVGADSLEYLEISLLLESRLGVQFSNEDWQFLSGSGTCKSPEEWEAKYAPMFTFGRLADLVAHRARLGLIKPVRILGSECLAAGGFRFIENAAERIAPKIERFAPSTPILERFRGHKLHEMWGLLRAVSSDRLPPLPRSPSRRLADNLLWTPGTLTAIVLGFLLFLVWSLFAASRVAGGWAQWFCMGVVVWPGLVYCSALLLLVVWAALRIGGPRFESHRAILPSGIETFRDLAMVLAGQRGGWCEKCGYELTGLTSGRCPECGMAQRNMGPGITTA